MDLERQKAKLQDEALDLLSEATDMDKRGAPEKEIEAKVEEANRIIAKSASLNAQIEKRRKKQSIILKLIMLSIILILVSLIGFSFWGA